MKIFPFVLSLVLGVGLAPGHTQELAPDSSSQTQAQRDARMAWWREARFGLFIHWGLYAAPAGRWPLPGSGAAPQEVPGPGEWIMHNARIPVADYQALAPRFNPVHFDAPVWVALAKAAGMRYVIITAKHHDGFALFKSQADPFNIAEATPFRRDPLRELAAACQQQGLKLGFYYSQDQDWTAPGGAAFGGHWDKAQDGDFARYLQNKAIPQIEELLTRYQPFPAVFWFDTPTDEMTPALASQIAALMNKHPNVIWNNRLGGGYRGDTETPEQSIPARGFPGRDWETCMTINDTWGFKTDDTDFKSTETLLHNLIDIASSGGNYLLNVGPDSQGGIPAPEVDRLQGMGRWLAANGEAIYATSATPLHRKPAWGRVTQRPGKLYLSVFRWPEDGKLLVPISNAVTKAYLLTRPNTVFPTTAGAAGLTVHLAGDAPDPVATVVVLETNGSITPVTELPLAQAGDGTIRLEPDTARIEGKGPLSVEHEPTNLGSWMDDRDDAHWSVQVKRPGTFQVSLDYALEAGSKGSELALTVGGQTLTIPLAKTAGWSDYRTIDVGTIRVEKAGTNDFVLQGRKGDGIGVANVRALALTPTP